MEQEILGEKIVYKKPSLNQIIEAIAERDVRKSMFFTCEMGRRYMEAKEPDLNLLHSEASPEDRKVFARLTSWGIEETMNLISSPDPMKLLKANKPALITLRDQLFSDDGPTETKDTSGVVAVEAEPEGTGA